MQARPQVPWPMRNPDAPAARAAKAVLFVNGCMAEPERFRDWIGADDYLVGVDGGAGHCLRMGLQPDVVIGDLDSLPESARRQLERAAVPFVRFPADKDKTDLELALSHVADQGWREAVLLGLWGGRLDQSVANLLLLVRYAETIRLTLATERETAYVLPAGAALRLTDRAGATASVLPLTAWVEGVSLTGMQYPLLNAQLRLGTSLGVSNAITEPEATVTLAQGCVLVVVSSHA